MHIVGQSSGAQKEVNKLTQVLFSFDTEDYTNPGADEAILRLATILTANGIRGCFNIVGELAVSLEERGRHDIINALSAHEIDFHSWRHTWHPTVVEYGDEEDWNIGYQRFLNEERRGMQAVKRIFNREILFSAVPPGNCIASQAPYVYHDLGIPLYSGSLFKGTKGKAIRYCNQINLENNLYPDDILWGEGVDEFIGHADKYLSYERVVACMHPNMAIFKQFWDALNCNRRNLVEFGEWNYPERHSPEEIERFFMGFEKIVRYFKYTPGYSIVTYEDVYNQERDKRHPLTPERLSRLLEAVKRHFFFAVDDGESFSLCEMYEASIHFASGGTGAFASRDKRGPINVPYAITEEVRFSADALKKAAWANRVFDNVPQALWVDGIKIGPSDFMWAVAQMLDGESDIVLLPYDCAIDTSGYYAFDSFKLEGTWMHSESFIDRFTTKRLRLQAWTIRE